MLYFNFQLKSSEAGLTKAGLTVTLRKDWLRKNLILTFSIQKKIRAPSPLSPRFECAFIEIQAHDIIFDHHAVSLKKYTPKDNAYDNALFQ